MTRNTSSRVRLFDFRHRSLRKPVERGGAQGCYVCKEKLYSDYFDIDYRAYNWKNDDEISIYYSAVAREADIILGSREEYDLTEKLIKQGMSDEETAKYWHSQNAKIVVIKHGKEGSTAYTMMAKAITLSRSPLNSLNPSAAETVTLPHSFTDF